MLSFYNFNDKTNIDRNKNHTDIFLKQGKTFTKLQKMTEKKEIDINDSHILSDLNSKKQNNFKEGFGNLENTFNNQTFEPPSLDYINYYKTKSENETANTYNLINQVNQTNYDSTQNIFNNSLQNYENENSLLIGNTNNYLNGQNTLNSNVFVNTYTNDNISPTFINLYQDNSSNPLMTILNGEYTYDTCSKTASLLGMNYFGLEQTDPSGASVCSVGNNVDINNFPIYTDKCFKATDGYTYGGGWANAIYQFEDGQPSYIGCYKDESNRAMIPTGGTTYNYNPVYFTGNYNTSPWNVTNYIDPTAQWVWYTEDSSNVAPVNPTQVLILGKYNNTTTSYQYADIYGCCDDNCTLIINNSNVDMSNNIMTIQYGNGKWNGNGYTGMSIPFYPGTNYIEVYVRNSGGPAGLILSFVDQTDNSTVFCNTNTSNPVNGSWSYSLVATSYNTPFSQSYSVQTCANYAKLFNYNYFALQNIQDHTPGTAQCFVSNDLTTAEEYGSLGGVENYNGNLYGVGYTNAIYSLDFSGNSSNMGAVGYVNELNQLSQYPSSMLSYGSSTTYNVLPDYDSSGNNIDISYNTSLKQCMSYANSNTSSYGFSYDNSNNICYIKNNKMYSPYSMNPNNGLYTSGIPPLEYQDNFLLYMKEPQIINDNSSCPVQIDNISSTEWSNYTNTGIDMSSTTLCKLQKANNEILETRQNYQNTLDTNSNNFTNNITEMINLNTELNNQINTDQEVLNTNVSLYQDIQNKYDYITSNMNSNINNILDNTSIVVKQQRFYYVLWLILAILIIIGFVYILRN
jgi:hypothetical protein